MEHIHVTWDAAAPSQVAPVQRLSAEKLHAEVIGSSSGLFANGHYEAAVSDAFKSIVVRVRAMTSSVGEPLRFAGRPVLELSVHQAKGREWDTVGLCLTLAQAQLLKSGLSISDDLSRKLCAASTRARYRTVVVQTQAHTSHGTQRHPRADQTRQMQLVTAGIPTPGVLPVETTGCQCDAASKSTLSAEGPKCPAKPVTEFPANLSLTCPQNYH